MMNEANQLDRAVMGAVLTDRRVGTTEVLEAPLDHSTVILGQPGLWDQLVIATWDHSR
ncbi:hypothetical protein [Mycolicibacterium psychrotolerans]|uniref:Uncharacterized protein n=1 Tax=Mycolicibacterium psychrotolerans TaxID=216929 RepID=A0A7I7MC29_9MYCO|nr:hypothetical protein [Mycolicibacterium psychrotolerans]BBX69410.1 hypothetical protein MPSYJ_28710 [Mycolicibacterium psychrotolerans]